MDAINAHNFVHEVNFSGLCDKDVQRPIDQFEGKKPVRQWANGAPAVHRSASHNKVCVEKIGEGVTAGGNGWIYAGLAPSGFVDKLRAGAADGVVGMGIQEVYLRLYLVFADPVIVAFQQSDVLPAASRQGFSEISHHAEVRLSQQW